MRMKTLFLTSSVDGVAHDVVKHIKNPTKKKLLFVDTAAEVEKGDLDWLRDDRNALLKAGFQVEDYTFTKKSAEEVRKKLQQVDALYVSGGNTFYLLQQIHLANCTKVIQEFVAAGKPYIGTSAGSIVAGPDISIMKGLDKLNLAPKLTSFTALELIDIVIFPHWGSDHFRQLYLQSQMQIAYQMAFKIILLTDHQYLYVQDDHYQIVDVRNDVH